MNQIGACRKVVFNARGAERAGFTRSREGAKLEGEGPRVFRCLGTALLMPVVFIAGIGVVLGGILLLGHCVGPAKPDQDLYAAPNRWPR